MSSEDRTPYPYEATGEVTHVLRDLAQRMVLAQGEDRDRLEREVDRLVRARLWRMREDIDALTKLSEWADLPVSFRGADFLGSELNSNLAEFTPGDSISIEGKGDQGKSIDERAETYPLRILKSWNAECLEILEQISTLEAEFEEAEGSGYEKQWFLPEERLVRLLALLPLPALEDLVRGSSEWEERAAPRRQQLSALLTRLEQEPAGPGRASLHLHLRKALFERDGVEAELRKEIQELKQSLDAGGK